MDIPAYRPRRGPRTSPAVRGILATLLLALAAGRLPAQVGPAPSYEAKLDVVTLPDGWNLGEVAAIAVDEREHLYVFHRGPHPLLEFDANGRVTMVLGMRDRAGLGWFDRDYDVHFLDRPQDVGFDSRGNVYVVDRGNSRIVRYDPEGRFVDAWGEEGDAPGQFDFPHAVVIDERDRVYVADRENRRIQIFDVEGRFLTEWTHVGYPYGLTVAHDGTLWITDARNERILQLDADGRVLNSIGGVHGKATGQFGFVHTIAVAPDGSVIVGEVLNWRLQRIEVP